MNDMISFSRLEDFGIRELPKDRQAEMFRYLFHGIRPDSFLYALLSNDFLIAVILSQHSFNRKFSLMHWVVWLNEHCHTRAYGSIEKVEEWILDGGLYGKMEKKSKAKSD